MAFFLSEKCFENDVYSRTSLGILNIACRLKVGKSHKITPFFQQSVCIKTLRSLYSSFLLLSSLTVNYKLKTNCAKQSNV